MMLKKLTQGILFGAMGAAIALLLWTTGTLNRWEFVTWSWRVGFFAAPGTATDKIKLILLDQASLDWGGSGERGWTWPWPREVYCPIIDFCRRGGARAIVFDVLYTEPSFYDVADDQALGAAIEHSQSFVAVLFLGKQTGKSTSWPREIRPPTFSVDNLDRWLKGASHNSIVMPRATAPIPEVSNNAAILANVTGDPDEDGIFRRVNLFRIFDDQVIPSAGLAPYLVSEQKKQAANLKMRIEKDWFHIGGKRIPVDSYARTILRFRGPSETHETFSAAAVIQSELSIRGGEAPIIDSPNVFKDSYVFFGFSAPGLLDLRPTPTDKIYPGVEVYATMLDNLLSDDFLRDASGEVVLFNVVFLALCTGILVMMSGKAWQNIAILIVFVSLPVLMGFVAYTQGLWWPIVVQETAVSLSFLSAFLVNYATEGRQKTFIKHAFKHYLSPVVIEQILKDPSQLKLGGERRELTILFSDLQGFSSISERLDPQTLTGLLNDYLSDMTDIILEEGGTLDKYEGDAIIAFWNAPLSQADHAIRACRAALRCQRKLDERREEFLERAGALLRMRIGIHTGEVVVGNMGSRKRFDYTVLGDAANLASRLEGANKVFATWTMVSDATWSQTAGEFRGREIGLVRVVGRKTPVRVYEIIGFALEEDTCRLEEYHQGLAFCRKGQWSQALEMLDKCSDDPVANIYAEQCRALIEDASATWDGIWNLTKK